MAKNNNLSDYLLDIANAIREKKGTTRPINAQDFANEIASIQTSGGGEAGSESDMIALLEGSISHLSSNATKIRQYAFRGLTSLKSVDLPNVESIDGNAFYATGLLSASFPKCSSMGAYAVSYTTSLVSIDFPELTTVAANGLRDNSALENVNLPKCVTINTQGLRNSKALKTIDLPKVTMIGSYAFAGSTQLSSITLRSSTVCQLDASSALSDTLIASGAGYIYVPEDLVDAYKGSTNWSTYSAQIRAINS